MADQEVKVLGQWGSPYSRRVELALKLKGVPYEYVEEDVYVKKSPLLLKSNPVHKKVPVLIHNGKPTVESLVIIEYIEETWKANPILPEDPYERAMARFWAKYIDDKCNPALWKAGWAEEEGREKAVEEAFGCLEVLENELKGKGTRFFGGDKIGLADIAANFIAFWLGIWEQCSGVQLLTGDKFPSLSNWKDEFLSCSVVKENLPPRENLVHVFQSILAKTFVASKSSVLINLK
ncbi:glutathione S-transferase U8-like [Tripterygium wilfordii]|uniref:glutathione S-transferase U8-like n=1 Tax=Tripterygium wilfordii TaxID=458696 RepID=UPI0018F82E1A|nr:glutathione S-transferase U8-like [Tripterygium wilfordii]